MKKSLRKVVNRLGFEVTRSGSSRHGDPLCEGFDTYLAKAEQANVDINDWLESELKWESALPTLDEVVFPYLSGSERVCEIGPGTGRHARHIIPMIGDGELHLFDHSTWVQGFLHNYFNEHRNVTVHQSTGNELDMLDESADLIFSNGTFIEMKLGTIYLLSREFARVCRKGGLVVFDYIDISTSEGWKYLESRSSEYSNCYTYHCEQTIDKVFAKAGFVPAKRWPNGKSTYVVFTKQ